MLKLVSLISLLTYTQMKVLALLLLCVGEVPAIQEAVPGQFPYIVSLQVRAARRGTLSLWAKPRDCLEEGDIEGCI